MTGDKVPPSCEVVGRRALRVLRLIAAALLALVSYDWATRVHTLVISSPAPGMPLRATVAAVFAALAVAWFAAFGVLFWVNMRRVRGPRRPLRVVLVLALQFVLAWLGSTELLVLVSLQAPLLLTGRALAAFQGVALALPALANSITFAFANGWVETGTLSLGPASAAHWPPWVRFALEQAMQLGWQTFGAASGWMLASAVRSWRALDAAHAELQAADALLEQTARASERGRLSQDLHDSLGHNLVALLANLELAERRCEGEPRLAVRATRERAQVVLDRLRRAVATLRRSTGPNLRPALELLTRASGAAHVELEWDAHASLEATRAQALFEALRELLAEGRAEGGRLRVELSQEAEGLRVTCLLSEAPAAALTAELVERLRARVVALDGRLAAPAGRSGWRIDMLLAQRGAP